MDQYHNPPSPLSLGCGFREIQMILWESVYSLLQVLPQEYSIKSQAQLRQSDVQCFMVT